jgi:serine/threonine protein kinase
MTTLTKTGRYQILDELGRGAMGVVYRAHDPVIGRDVAVKTMHLAADGSGATRPDFISRFQTEARAAGILTHPNIVVVYDAGEEGGTFYITMELVEGRSLQSLIDEHQSFPLPRAVRIIEQASSALDYAHRHNIIHRDVKPANLMITSDDTVKVTDFGTAKILQFNTAQTAAVIGTPSYMSPEQIKGKTVDGRSDIFALGVILYELVTGEKPFPGQNITTVIYKIVNEEPVPPREIDPSIHSGLCAVIARALAKDPTARFQTCGELLEALKNYKNLATEPKGATHPAMPPYVAGSKITLKGGQPINASSRPTLSLAAPQNIARAISVPAAGHTLYGENLRGSRQRKWSTFWFSLLLLGVIAATGYFIRPYTDDVFAVLHDVFAKKSAPAQTPSAAPANPASSAPIVPARNKSAKPVVSAPAVKSNDASSSVVPGEKPAPSENSSVTEKPTTENPAEGLAKSSAPIVPPATDAASAIPAPTSAAPPTVASPQIPLRVRLANLKSTIEQRLSNDGLGDRVHVKIEGATLVLQGHLRPAEHQALLNRLRASPDWIRITDDILPVQ